MSLYTKTCEVCDERISRYRCPRCGVLTCSMACCKLHKNGKNCSGIREKTAYVSMNDFTDLTLLNDYRFLEDAERKIDTASKENKLKGNLRYKPKYFCILQSQARKRGTSLQVLPTAFTRHKCNKSYYDYKKGSIDWTVEWRFNDDDIKPTTSKVSESKILLEAFEEFISEYSSKVPSLENALERYTAALRDDKLKIFFKVERISKNQKNKLHEVDLKRSLMENLKDKTILEFPTFLVTAK
ncbi:hypothetical protein HELRODRAFT_194795 [Helobdella robusta]|uniref:HIT-type domain-containing protein n=1 Tax=Helobdella robusta TaxID=6412 RepID=T1FWF1_HELRO|nr:hypothetical protein HELRODRAFT_194795 [Helobdella robusta]ESN89838.1 hypothetical protein HELRODRAFT_194795 [Helobdella robusta]